MTTPPGVPLVLPQLPERLKANIGHHIGREPDLDHALRQIRQQRPTWPFEPSSRSVPRSQPRRQMAADAVAVEGTTLATSHTRVYEKTLSKSRC
jgi:hypothetical protein